LRRVDKNFKSFFKTIKDFHLNPDKYKGKPNPPHFKQKQQDNLVYDYQAFSIKGEIVILELIVPHQNLDKFILYLIILHRIFDYF